MKIFTFIEWDSEFSFDQVRATQSKDTLLGWVNELREKEIAEIESKDSSWWKGEVGGLQKYKENGICNANKVYNSLIKSINSLNDDSREISTGRFEVRIVEVE